MKTDRQADMILFSNMIQTTISMRLQKLFKTTLKVTIPSVGAKPKLT
jgi:hypothetical protein